MSYKSSDWYKRYLEEFNSPKLSPGQIDVIMEERIIKWLKKRAETQKDSRTGKYIKKLPDAL